MMRCSTAPRYRLSQSMAPRHGMAILAAMICLLMLSALSVSLVRTVLASIREASLHESQLQADALAESAIARGTAQSQSTPSYTGEVWTPEVAGAPRLKANIQWTESPTGRSLKVRCYVPADADHPVCVERSIIVPTLPLKKTE